MSNCNETRKLERNKTAADMLREKQLIARKSKQEKIDTRAEVLFEKIMEICNTKVDEDDEVFYAEINYNEIGLNSEFLEVDPGIFIQNPAMIEVHPITTSLKKKLMREGFEIFDNVDHYDDCPHMGICHKECKPWGFLLKWSCLTLE